MMLKKGLLKAPRDIKRPFEIFLYLDKKPLLKTEGFFICHIKKNAFPSIKTLATINNNEVPLTVE
jgi:hypothetical protein